MRKERRKEGRKGKEEESKEKKKERKKEGIWNNRKYDFNTNKLTDIPSLQIIYTFPSLKQTTVHPIKNSTPPSLHPYTITFPSPSSHHYDNTITFSIFYCKETWGSGKRFWAQRKGKRSVILRSCFVINTKSTRSCVFIRQRCL